METKEERMNIFGTHFSCLDLEEGFRLIANYNFNDSSYVCFVPTPRISHAFKDSKLRKIYNSSLITFADGKFTEFYAALKGNARIKNVSGYWLLDKLLQTKMTHYFYGCDDKTLKILEKKLRSRYPTANILGFKAPPYLELHDIDNDKQVIEDFNEINILKPDLVWIGISTPKQDYLMYHYKKYLDNGILLGVGAVFLYYAGVINKGPEFIKKLALRGLWRFFQEPVRIYKKNVFFNLLYFLFLIFKYDMLKIKLHNSFRDI